MSHRFEEKPRADDWDNVNGQTTVRRWEGPADDYSVFAATVPSGFCGYRKVTHPDGWTEVEARYAIAAPGGEVGDPNDEEYGLVTRNWELHYIERELPLSAHPNVTVLAARDPDWPAKMQVAARAFKQAYATYLKRKLEGVDDDENPEPFAYRYATETGYPTGSDSDPNWKPFEPSAPEGITVNEFNLARECYAVLVNTDDPTYEYYQYVLEKVEVVTSVSSVRASHTNRGRILTSAALLRTERSLDAVTLLDTAELMRPNIYWRKKPPKVSPVQRGLWRITQSFEHFEAWLEFSYGKEIK
jgi:hypothetical protein